MSTFPLYDNLIKDISTVDLTIKQKNTIVKSISKLDDNTKELIYVLVQYYFKKNENIGKKIDDSLPYSGDKKQIKNNKILYDVSWNLTDLPIQLRQILYKFITLHLKQKEEDIKRCEYEKDLLS